MEFSSIHHGYSEFVLLDFHTCFRMKQWFVFFWIHYIGDVKKKEVLGLLMYYKSLMSVRKYKQT